MRLFVQETGAKNMLQLDPFFFYFIGVKLGCLVDSVDAAMCRNPSFEDRRPTDFPSRLEPMSRVATRRECAHKTLPRTVATDGQSSVSSWAGVTLPCSVNAVSRRS